MLRDADDSCLAVLVFAGFEALLQPGNAVAFTEGGETWGFLLPKVVDSEAGSVSSFGGCFSGETSRLALDLDR